MAHVRCARATEATMENLQYSIWQKPYENALTELDPLRVAERVAAAEAAIAMRMKQASTLQRHPI